MVRGREGEEGEARGRWKRGRRWMGRSKVLSTGDGSRGATRPPVLQTASSSS